uniref:Uncharacterized protein n=2 Tax=Peronospora matthiolae TaxID=2874970 RepID=A0AAV1UVY1_9STRA
MTESKPSSNTLEEFLEEGILDYGINTVASSVYDIPPATPPARDTTRVASNPFVEREEVPSPLAQRADVGPALGVLNNTLDGDQAQYLHSVNDHRRQAYKKPQRMLAVVTASHDRVWMNAFVKQPGGHSQHGSRYSKLLQPKSERGGSLSERETWESSVQPPKITSTG